MNPILFASAETKFDTNGIGVLSDAISCIVTEERNGSFELTMQYSVEGIHYADIADRSIILAKPSPTDNPQPFRVYRHTKPLNGIVTFYARHISYDLSGTPVGPFTATNVIDALNKLKTNAVIPCPFGFWTDKVTVASMNVRVPSDIFSLLGGQQGSVLDVYGGEYKFDGYTVRLYNERGTDRGVSIRYGKNLLDLEQEKNCANVCTGVYPYWVDSNGENLVQLSEKIVNAPGTYDFVRIKMLDLSSEWQEAPSTEQLKARAETYIKENNIGVPTISLTVSHAMLENTEEYKGQALLERIDLCDTARIEFPKLGVSASAKAVKTEFNALLNRYESITFGDARYTLADNTVDQKKALEESTNKASGLVAEAMKRLNEIVQNSSGLYTTEEIQPDKSVIYYYHDKPNLTESKNVIKFTADAIGLSTDGGKTYPFGFTVTGDMVANILSTIGINANWINAGILQSMPDESGDRNFIFDLVTGLAEVRNLTIRGKNVADTLDSTVTSVKQQYYQSDSPVALTGGNWSDTQPAWTEGKYIWNRQYVKYGDEREAYLPSEQGVCITGNTGADGQDGAAGVPGAPGSPGKDGENGIGIVSVEAEYYISDSDTQAIGGSWSANIPEVQPNKYIWTRQKATYTDNSVEYVGEYCMSKTVGDIAQQKVDAQTQEDIFNKLTNNGELQGIFMRDGKLYINAEYLRGDTIDLNFLKLAGTICGLMQGEGSTADGKTTTGIVVYGNGVKDDGSAKPPYIIVTSDGIRLQLSDDYPGEYIYFSNGYARLQGENFTASGDIFTSGGRYGIGPGSGYVAIEYDQYLPTPKIIFGSPRVPGIVEATWIRGYNVYINEDDSANTYIRGDEIYLSKDYKLSSDARLKKDIEPMSDAVLCVLDNLTPVSYRYKREADNAPKHWGYTAQDVEAALKKSGLERSDMAALGDYETENGEKYMSIAYGELIAALHLKIKSLEERIKGLEAVN